MPENELGNIQRERNPQTGFNYWLWGAIGILLLAGQLFLAVLSGKFSYGQSNTSAPIITVAAVLALSGMVYLMLLFWRGSPNFSNKLIFWILAVGIGMRIFLLPSNTILEDDVYRYLWDGAVVTKFINPYRYSPEEVMKVGEPGNSVPAILPRLAKESGNVFQRINHRHLRSIYPMTTQLAFGISHLLGGWTVLGWRLLLFVVDGLTLLLLFKLLKKMKWPLYLTVFYWWNPLLIFETFNGNHMDILIFPFLLGAFLLVSEGAGVAAGLLLAFAVGTKVWPILLLPFFIRYLAQFPGRVLKFLGVFLVGSLLLYLPLFSVFVSDNSGFLAYGQKWELNDALFRGIVWGSSKILPFLGGQAGYGQQTARILVVSATLLAVLWLSRRKIISLEHLISNSFWIVAVVFLLSPTQFPWYFTWLVPFFVFRPNLALMLLTALLPLYFLRYYFDALGRPEIFDSGIVWIEFVPVWILLIKDLFRNRRRSTKVAAETTG